MAHGDRVDGATSDDQLGFTLIELLIVIVVLGILAGVTVFALSGTTAKSATAACSADAQTVNVALQAFAVANPGVLATTGATGSLVVAGTTGGPYLQSWPVNTTHYTISLTTVAITAAAPQSVVVTPTGGTAGNYPATNPCTSVS